MREHLIRYVDLLFAGTPDAADIKQEILQNTLDRYDDLVAQGKSPEAAYQLAISGIGDIREILGGQPTVSAVTAAPAAEQEAKPTWKKVLQAIGICLYILSPLPLFALQDEYGLCGLLTFCAVATALMILSGGNSKVEKQETQTPQTELQKVIRTVVFVVGVCVFLVISFLTGAWYITWVIFPLCAAVNGLIRACMDLKEASKHEN